MTFRRIGCASFVALSALLWSTTTMAQSERLSIQLSVEDAVQRAIDRNPDLAIVRLDTHVETARVGEARGAYAPVFSTVFGRSRNVTPPTNFFLGDAGVDQRDWFSTTGVRQRVPWGAGTWSISWDAARTSTNSPITSVDPILQSGLELAFSQPLLRDRKIDASRQQVLVATRNEQNAELRVRESAVQTVAAVKRAYWALKASVANMGVQQRSLELAEELARQNRIRANAGQIPPVDVVQAEAEVAQRRENLIQARTLAEDAEDGLRRLIMDPADARSGRPTWSRSTSHPRRIRLPTPTPQSGRRSTVGSISLVPRTTSRMRRPTSSFSGINAFRTSVSRPRTGAAASPARSFSWPAAFLGLSSAHAIADSGRRSDRRSRRITRPGAPA